MKIPQNTGKKREKKYFGISRFSLERVNLDIVLEITIVLLHIMKQFGISLDGF